MILTPEQCRAARALLDWKQEELREKSGISQKTIADFERDRRQPLVPTLVKLRQTFEAAGIEFLDNGEGQGVRLKTA